jgi:UDP-N-acetylglucosamine:LPS N-acetylglucosamine transferase
LTTEPVSRPILTPRDVIRSQLSIPQDALAVLITMGGIETGFDFITTLEETKAYYFIIPGGSPQAISRMNLRLLPHHSGFYHPDLVAASDAIIGKLGYSTLSEACTAGIPYGFIPRSTFRESPPLAAYVTQMMSGLEILESDYTQGNWVGQLPQLLSQPRKDPPRLNGADQIAHWLLRYLV